MDQFQYRLLAGRMHTGIYFHVFPIRDERMLLPNTPRVSPPQEQSFVSQSNFLLLHILILFFHILLFFHLLILFFKINDIRHRGTAWPSLLLSYESLYL